MDEFKVDHPEFGHVVFTGMTGRQKEILEIAQQCIILEKTHGNDQEYGKLARKAIKTK